MSAELFIQHCGLLLRLVWKAANETRMMAIGERDHREIMASAFIAPGIQGLFYVRYNLITLCMNYFAIKLASEV